MAETVAEKPKKAKDRVLQLNEHRRGLYYNLIAQYGTRDDPRFVMSVNVDGEIFQGIGPSRKRAKTMAAEQALVHLSVLNSSDIEKPEPEIDQKDDLTADVFDSSGLFYKFTEPKVDSTRAACTNVTPLMAIDVGLEDGDDDAEYDEYACYIGRNSLSILSELRPDATFRLVYESRNASKSKFVMTCKVDGEIFRGEAPNKKLAKARAARDALQAACGIEFGHAEDGMPIYEGSEKVWQKYKAKLEKESHKLVGTFSVKNPVAELHELFPDSTYKFKDDKVDIGEFYQCKITVNGEEYEGLGRNKKDAKANAATNALEGLRVSGFLDQHMKELEAKKQAKVEKLKELEKFDGSGKGKDRLEKLFNVSAAPAKNAVSKLNEIFPSIEYKIVGEMPVKNTCMTAFAVSVQVNRRTYTGIGKNKKLAKMAAAEKALRGLGLWTEDDEYMKVYALRGDRQLEETLENQMWRGAAPVRGGGRGKQGFSFGPVRGGRGAARGGFGFGGGVGGDAFQSDFQGGYAGLDWEENEFYEGGFDGGSGQDDEMIFKLSSIVARILERNPDIGASEVFRKLELDDSWQGGPETWQGEFDSGQNEWQGGADEWVAGDEWQGGTGEWQGDAWSEPPGRGRRGRGNLVRGVRPLVPSLLGGEVRQPVPPLFSGGGRQPVPSLLSGGGVRQSIPSLIGNGVRPSILSLVGGAVRQPVPSLVGRGGRQPVPSLVSGAGRPSVPPLLGGAGPSAWEAPPRRGMLSGRGMAGVRGGLRGAGQVQRPGAYSNDDFESYEAIDLDTDESGYGPDGAVSRFGRVNPFVGGFGDDSSLHSAWSSQNYRGGPRGAMGMAVGRGRGRGRGAFW